jgi:hypothetical protein
LSKIPAVSTGRCNTGCQKHHNLAKWPLMVFFLRRRRRGGEKPHPCPAIARCFSDPQRPSVRAPRRLWYFDMSLFRKRDPSTSTNEPDKKRSSLRTNTLISTSTRSIAYTAQRFGSFQTFSRTLERFTLLIQKPCVIASSPISVDLPTVPASSGRYPAATQSSRLLPDVYLDPTRS